MILIAPCSLAVYMDFWCREGTVVHSDRLTIRTRIEAKDLVLRELDGVNEIFLRLPGNVSRYVLVREFDQQLGELCRRWHADTRTTDQLQFRDIEAQLREKYEPAGLHLVKA